MRFCNECNDKNLCNKCNNQIKETKVFEAILIEQKKDPPNEFGYMLPYFEKWNGLFVIVVQFLLCFIEKKILFD